MSNTNSWPLSQRAQKLESSAIREILKVTALPDIISFAGGLPSPATFPATEMAQAVHHVLTEQPTTALQYSTTEGYPPLRQWVAQRLSTPAFQVNPDHVLIVSGSQQSLDLVGKTLIDPASKVLVETPTYLGALQSFSLFEPTYVQVASDADGVIPDQMTAEMLQDARFLYAQPNFQNPTGRRTSLARRKQLVEVARKNNLLIMEDDPYGALDYFDNPLPSLLSLAPERVIYQGTFSKVLAPGLRIGYVVAPPELLFKLVQAKQATDLHTATFTQQMVYEVVKDGFLDQQIPRIRKLYQEQCEAMLAALEKYMPQGVHWNRPEGGMFLWLELPASINTLTLLKESTERCKVAFVPGAPFYAGEPVLNTMRLSFVTVLPEKIDKGIKALAELIQEKIG